MSLNDIFLKAKTYKVISFDFFDTLFFRKVEEPESVFDLIGNKFGIDNFRALRKRAQQLAFIEMHEKGKKEITIEDIYNNFYDLDKIQREAISQYEIYLEHEIVYPNDDIVKIYQSFIDEGKEVVITSDMYLSGDYFEFVLKKHNLPLVKLFISADRNATKRDHGELFDIIMQECGVSAEDILHIGDNQQADIEKAEAKGLSTYHYDVHMVAQRKNIPLAESVVNGLAKANPYSFAKESGEDLAYQFGGPTASGFYYWLKDMSIVDEIDVLLFLSRDGYILKKISERCEPVELQANPKKLYFKGSRTSFMLSGITESNFEDYIQYFLSGAHELSAHELFERIGVEPPSRSVLESLGFDENEPIKKINNNDIYNLLFSMKKDILTVCRKNRRGLHQLLLDMDLPENARIGLVDVGWRGTTQDAFECAIQPFFNYDIIGYYLCLIKEDSVNKKSLLNSASYSSELINKIYENRLIFELFFSAPHETIIGHLINDTKVDYIESESSKNSKDFFEPLEKGMLAFFDSLNEFTSKTNFLPDQHSLLKPLVEFAISGEWRKNQYISLAKNFDAWSSTQNMTILPGQYT